jgi:CHAD domain-containing protein
MTTVDPSYQLLACRYLRRQLDVLIKELRGVRLNEDIEPVHQARVASRRMRAAFSIFGDCFEPKLVRRWQKRVRKLTQGLGAARDKDVQILFVESFLAGLEPQNKRNRPGVGRLLLRLRQEREALQPAVIKTLDGLAKGDVLAEMHGEVEKILFTLRTHDVKLQSAYVFEQAGRHIRRRRHDLSGCEHALADAQDIAGHHQMRIAAKKLRYTMEICDAAYAKALTPFIKTVKKLQTLLGDIHDCDVWVENVDVFVGQERQRAVEFFGHDRPFLRLLPGLSALRDERRGHREVRFGQLVTFWRDLQQNAFWAELEKTLQSHERVAPASTSDGRQEESHDPEEEGQENSAGQ